MPTDLTKLVNEWDKNALGLDHLYAVLKAMAKQIEVNEDEIERVAKIVEP